MFVIRSDRLRVDVAVPGEGTNSLYRFARAGYVDEIVLDGGRRFCASEPYNRARLNSRGRGLCSEYIAQRLYDDAPVGGKFPKPGVGLMLKEDAAPYHYFRAYKTEPFPVEAVDVKPDAVTFVTSPVECNGVALEETRTLSVAGNKLLETVELKNVGSAAFEAEEYCHNFLTIDGMAVGPAYRVEIPCMKDRGGAVYDDFIVGDGSAFAFRDYRKRPAFVALGGGEFDLPDGAPFRWALLNRDAGVRVDGEDRIRFSRVQLWLVDHMISIEAFHKLDLAPGAQDAWTRSWTFSER